LLIASVAGLHYLIPTDTHAQHQLHIVARKLYFVPLVVAAAWFGLRGALITTCVVSGLFGLHAVLDWPGNYMEQANQLGELIAFWAVGLLAGRLVDRERLQLTRLASAHEETVTGLVSALDLREHGTGLHSQRVREYALLLADRVGVGASQREQIAYGALLHDVGKIAVPDEILLKPGALTDAEWKVMREHPATAYRIVRRVAFLEEAAEIVFAHHERFDGGGYPRGLRREEIPLGARLFGVADVYDALTSVRPYRLPVSHDQAVATIRARSGTDFDPAVVAALLLLPRAEMARAVARLREQPATPPPSVRSAQ
jgi:putative nucleotidyltransferase with HDIG domain